VYYRPAHYLGDREEVRRQMAQPPSAQWHWRVTATGEFQPFRPIEPYREP
jgi:hypothetical protein